MSKVKVKADKNGNIIQISENNPEYGGFIVEQEATEIVNGWFRKVVRTARIAGGVKDLQEAKLTAGQEMPGKIVVKESLIPFNSENPDSDLKIAGSTGVICRYDDQPIYRKSFFTANLNDTDEFISHTNSEEIKQVLEAQRAMAILSSTNPSEAVSL